MRDTPETIAREIVARWFADCWIAQKPRPDEAERDQLIARIAAAIAKDRAETMEACARMADEKKRRLQGLKSSDDRVWYGVGVADGLANEIRSLSTPPRAEP